MKRRAVIVQLVPLVTVAIIAACSSGGAGSGFGDGGGPTTKPTGSSTGSTGFSIGSSSSGVILKGTDSGMVTPPQPDGGPCPYTTGTVDHDGDGWSPADGDCNDCNKYINPGAYDVPGNGIDDDCDGTVDDAVTNCDSTLTNEATTNGMDGATAMDLCKSTTADPPLPMKTWGVISAAYVLPDNSPSPTSTGPYGEGPCDYNADSFQLGFGILGPTFGPMNQTQHGVRMLGLSSGTARQPSDPGYQPVWGFDKCYTSGAPSGFPGQTPACGNVQFGKPHDGAALQVVLRVPTNAVTMSFDSNFFSYEFPEWVCTPYNDTYVVIMLPSPAGEPTNANENIAFDSKGNIISINAGFLTVCNPTTHAGQEGGGNYTYACPEGPAKLEGTGFGSDSPAPPGGKAEAHASTDWLTTTASVTALAGKSITLLFAVWDSTDGILDTTVLIDNFSWTFATGPNDIPPVDAGSPMTLPK